MENYYEQEQTKNQCGNDGLPRQDRWLTIGIATFSHDADV